MFGLTSKTDYGILLLASLVPSKNPVSLKKIASEKNLPYKFLTQIAIPLRKAGVISSKEGISGGYFLAKKPQEINLKEILEILEGPLGSTRCTIHLNCPAEGSCMMKSFWVAVQKDLSLRLENKTLADLVERG